jgi:eukaryotic-like serine/threonine-protein kinase
MSSTYASQNFASTMQAVDSELGAQGSFGHLGRYRLDRIIGHGAMGAVFEAHDPTLGRMVAIKTLQPEDDSTETDHNDVAILQEARVAATLSHPHIVTVFDAGRARSSTLRRDLPYVAMELLHGEDLRQHMARPEHAHMRVRDAVALVGKVALALDVAHKKGILHRDIKPANIFVTEEGQPKILDFGLAHITRRSTKRLALNAPHADVVGGSPQYMSPELIRSVKDPGVVVDAKSDVYSLGVVLYELLCGKVPFTAPTLELLQERICHNTPPSPLELEPDVPRDLSDLVMRALAKRPDDRFRSAGQFARELKRWGRGLLDAELPHEPGTMPGPLEDSPGAAQIDTDDFDSLTKKPARGKRAGMLLALFAVLAVGLGLWRFLEPATSAPNAIGEPMRQAQAPAAAKPAIEPSADTAAPQATAVPAAAAAAEDPTAVSTATTVTPPADGVAASARVRLTITPWGEVEVDGRKVGVSPPLTVLNLSPGEHTLVLRNSDFPARTVRLKLEAQKTVRVQHKFE